MSLLTTPELLLLDRLNAKNTIDTRSFSHQALEEMRMSAVQRIKAGESLP